MSLVPDQATFRQLAQKSDLIPVCLDLMADLETPVSVYARLRALGSPFLFESVTAATSSAVTASAAPRRR